MSQEVVPDYDGSTIQRLAALEEIRLLKARYFRLLDTQRWDEWRKVFTEDLTTSVEGIPERSFTNRDDWVNAVAGLLVNVVTVHHGYMPELEVHPWSGASGPISASGIWAMFDYLEYRDPESLAMRKGYGHYHETYRRDDGKAWRIASLHITRLRLDPF